MQHLLTSKHNVSQQWEQRHEIHRSPRPNKSSIEGDEGEQQAVVVIMQRMREQEQMEADESEPSFVITRADTNASWRTALAQRCIQMSWLPLKCDLIAQPAADFPPFYSCNVILLQWTTSLCLNTYWDKTDNDAQIHCGFQSCQSIVKACVDGEKRRWKNSLKQLETVRQMTIMSFKAAIPN